MVKRSKIGKRSKKRHTKKRNKQYKKRYSKKRYNKKNNLKGGRLTPRQLELLRKVEERSSYCNRGSLPLRKKRNEQECNDRNEVCEWRNSRCMKNMMNVHSMDRFRNTEYYPPFTKVEYLVGGQVGKTTISNIPFLKENGIINDSTLILIDGEMPQRLRVINHLIKHPSPPRSPEDTPPGFGAPSPPTPPRTPPLSPEGHPPVQGEETDIWIKKRNDMEKKTRRRTGLTYSRNIYVDPQTNINIVRDVLSKEAKFESNIYLHLDDAHGRIIDIDRPTILNNNFHLLLTVARGHGDRWSSVDNRGELALLSIMKRYLDNDGHNNLFDREGCMTSNGSLLFYSIMFIHEFGISTMDFIMNLINRGEKITLSKILNLISDNLLKIDTNTDNYITERMKNFFFRILKLYNPDDEINNTTFAVEKEETEKAKRLKRGSTSPYDEAKWGVTILYTNDSDENKYIHLPLNEIPRINGDILLSQILDYLKPLTELGDKLFLKHGSCRVDDEHFKCKPEYGDNGSGRRPTEYKPELSSLTRGISNPKEIAEKNCFINSFREEQRDDVRDFLRAYPTMIDYYLWLEINGKLDDYIIALMEHDEGSLGLYEFISKNYK